MKKSFFLLFVFLGLVYSEGRSQFYDFEIAPVSGYQFSTSFSGSNANVNIYNSASYGVSLGFPLFGTDNKFELQYYFMPSHANITTTNSTISPLITDFVDLNINHILAGYTYEKVLQGEMISAFGYAGVGVSWGNPLNSRYTALAEMSFSLQGGMKFFFDRKRNIGIKANVGFIFPTQLWGAVFMVDPGGDVNFGTDGAVTMAQFNSGIGLVFRF